MKFLKNTVLCCVFIAFLSSSAWAWVDQGEYLPTALPNSDKQYWFTSQENYGKGTLAVQTDGTEIALNYNTMTQPNDMIGFGRYINTNQYSEIEVEAKIKVNKSIGVGGVAIWVEDNNYGEVLQLYENSIDLYRSNKKYYMDTTNEFHVYRILVKDDTIKVFVDQGEVPVLEAPFNNTTYSRSFIIFGDSNPSAQGDASWAYLKYEVR